MATIFEEAAPVMDPQAVFHTSTTLRSGYSLRPESLLLRSAYQSDSAQLGTDALLNIIYTDRSKHTLVPLSGRGLLLFPPGVVFWCYSFFWPGVDIVRYTTL